MEAKRCDRCGRYYDPYEMKIPEEFRNESMPKEDRMNHIVLQGTDIRKCSGMPIGASKYIDLCPRCMEGLIRYIRGEDINEPVENVITLTMNMKALTEIIKETLNEQSRDNSCKNDM